MPIAKVNGIHLYYEQHGQGDDLVLITGLSSHHTTWFQILGPLSEYFKVTIFDNRGSGQSSQPHEPYTAELMAQDVAALMEHLHIPSAFVAGHSMGGQILQALAVHFPEKVRAGAIMGSSLAFAKTAQMQFVTSTKLMMAGLSLELLLEVIFPWIFGSEFLRNPEKVNAEIQRIRHNPHPQSPAGYQGQVHALGVFDYSAQASRIMQPMLVLGGAEDLLSPPTHQVALNQILPDSTLKLLDQCGHMIQREKPEACTQALIRFFKSIA